MINQSDNIAINEISDVSDVISRLLDESLSNNDPRGLSEMNNLSNNINIGVLSRLK
jgi:hypothetical protein